jgi:ribosomal protein L37AE/L43A
LETNVAKKYHEGDDKIFKKCPYCKEKNKNYGVYYCHSCENGGCYQLGITANTGCWGSELDSEDEYECPNCDDGGTVERLGYIWFE